MKQILFVLLLLISVNQASAESSATLSQVFEELVSTVENVDAESKYFELSRIVWVDGIRKEWSGNPELFSLPENLKDRYLDRNLRVACWRGFSASADTVIEWQVRLSNENGMLASNFPDNKKIVIQLESDPKAVPPNMTIQEEALFQLPETQASEKIRLSILQYDEQQVEQQKSSQKALLFYGLFPLLLLIPGLKKKSITWILLSLLIIRIFWLSIDYFHFIPKAFPGSQGIALPTSLVSLIDPAYFASTRFLGLFASSADALITSMLFATILLSAGKRLIGKRDVVTINNRFVREIVFGLIAGVGLIVVSEINGEIVGNANARLIGTRIPLLFPTFWVLHASLLLISGSVAAFLVSLANWLRNKEPASYGFLTVIAALLPLFTVGIDLFTSGKFILLTMVWLLWMSPLLRPSGDVPMRRLSWTLPLLIAICWNYMNIAGDYWRIGGNWLERKSIEISEPGQERARFLVENLLTEIVANSGTTNLVAKDNESELWNDWTAYSLWQQAGIGEMNLPCRLDLINRDGAVVSMFSTGSLRDYGYEISNRSDWVTTNTVLSKPGVSSVIHIQQENRVYPDGAETVLRGEIEQKTGGWIGLELITESTRLSTLRGRIGADRKHNPSDGYSPRQEVDSELLLLRGTGDRWLSTGSHSTPADVSENVIRKLQNGEIETGHVWVDGVEYRSVWSQPQGEDYGYLLGIAEYRLRDRVLDMSRLVLLDLLLLALFGLLSLPFLFATGKLPQFKLGFQERFLSVYLILGLLPLLLAGTFINRLSRDWLADEARAQVSQGLNSAQQQLRGLLAEQGRALAGSDYIGDLISSRVSGSRPLGPFEARQGMVYKSDGTLLLDETLSDLDNSESQLLLEQARNSLLFLMQDETGTFVGTVLPVDLSELTEDGVEDGYFIYRQLINSDLVTGLGQVVQGEVNLYIDGEIFAASHPEQIFSDNVPLFLPPKIATAVSRNPGNPYLNKQKESGLSWSGMLSMPVLRNENSELSLAKMPAVLSVTLPAREAEFLMQRDRTILFIAGLATLIFITAMFLGLVLTWQIFLPVRVLLDATKRLAGGDYDAPLPESGGDEVGTLSESFGSMRDNLRSAQSQLADREKFLANLLDTVPVGVAVYDSDGNNISINKSGSSIVALFDENETALLDLVGRFQKVVSGSEGVAEISSDDMSRTLRGRIAPLLLPDSENHILLVFEDVTEFLSNKRMAINAELARQVAHEVKNPLTPIMLSVQFLKQAWQDNAENMDEILGTTVDQVLHQVQLLRTIASEFSLLGRPDQLECGSVDLFKILNDVGDGYMKTDGSPLIILDKQDLPPVIAHKESLHKIFANIIENALQSCESRDELELTIEWAADENSVSVKIIDNGQGLAPGVAERLFEPYFSTKNDGTGLGLPICRNLLNRMGGTISLANRNDGSGVVAEVSLRRVT